MCSSRAFRPPKSLTNYYCDTNHGFIRSKPPSSPSTPPPPACECGGYCPGEKPYTAEELRRIKEVLDKNREEIEEWNDYLKWCEGCNKSAEEQYLNEIKDAQEKIRKDIDHKRAQKLAAAAMADEAWVFEKSANGWI